MRYALALLLAVLSLTAVAQSSPGPRPGPEGQTVQPKDAEVDRDKPVQGNQWSLQAKSPDAGGHKNKGKPDGGH